MTIAAERPTIVLPIPGRCIWCLKPAPPNDPSRSDTSHVVHACLGNAEQQVLPPGIVCKPCNGVFGTKLDRELIEFPPLRMNGALLEVMHHPDKKRLFRDSIPDVGPIPDAPSEVIEVLIGCTSMSLVLDLWRPIIGHYEVTYTTRRLRLLSRAVHKLLFESVAWHVYVRGHNEAVDLFDSAFDAVRRWVRYGEPQTTGRPWLWHLPSQNLLQAWRVEPLHRVRGRGFTRMRLLGSWFFADLTSDNDDVMASLSESQLALDIYCIGDWIVPTENWTINRIGPLMLNPSR